MLRKLNEVNDELAGLWPLKSISHVISITALDEPINFGSKSTVATANVENNSNANKAKKGKRITGNKRQNKIKNNMTIEKNRTAEGLIRAEAQNRFVQAPKRLIRQSY